MVNTRVVEKNQVTNFIVYNMNVDEYTLSSSILNM